MLNEKINRYYLNMLKRIIIFIFVFILVLVCFSESIYGDNWLKADIAEGEEIWIDTSHWENKRVMVEEGYYKETLKKEWINTTYTINSGYWKTEEYLIWVNSSTVLPYIDHRWVDTSHAVRRFREISKWIPANFIIYVGTNSYGWGVYSFAAKAMGSVTIIYNGNRYHARKWVIDYKPIYGGRVKATKYLIYGKEITSREYYNVWVSSGYWQPYTAYRTIDASHWETRTRSVWVNTSYDESQGYWNYYTQRDWIDSSHYEYEPVWVAEGFYTSPLNGEVIIQKDPKYIFTKWHKDSIGDESQMNLKISWEIDNSMLLEGEEEKEIIRVNVYEDIVRFNGQGNERVLIYNSSVTPSQMGTIETVTSFGYSGIENSTVHIYLYSQNGESAHIYFSNPINGFRSINLGEEGSNSDANKWLGGNNYGKIKF